MTTTIGNLRLHGGISISSNIIFKLPTVSEQRKELINELYTKWGCAT
jgi:hypothetical protein